MKFMKDIKQTRTSWFAKSGGIMVIWLENLTNNGLLKIFYFQGLCMGFSLISAAEIIYHCFLILCRGLAAAKAHHGSSRSNADTITESADMDLWLQPTLTENKGERERHGNNSDEEYTDSNAEDEASSDENEGNQIHDVSIVG